jgi:hypothetical protein
MEEAMWKLTAGLVVSILVGSAALAHEGGHRAHGVVKEVTATRLVVTDAHGKETDFAVTAETRFVRERKPTLREKVIVGERVVVKGKDGGGRLEATLVSVGPDRAHDH